jgi:hypothetical protein
MLPILMVAGSGVSNKLRNGSPQRGPGHRKWDMSLSLPLLSLLELLGSSSQGLEADEARLCLAQQKSSRILGYGYNHRHQLPHRGPADGVRSYLKDWQPCGFKLLCPGLFARDPLPDNGCPGSLLGLSCGHFQD